MASENIDNYGVLAGNVLNLNSGASKITGDVGSFNTITGSGSANISGATNTGASINTTLSNANLFYTTLSGLLPDTTTTNADIAGLTFNPGVNALTNIGGITISGSSAVTLDGAGTYIFQVVNGGITTDPTLGTVYFNCINNSRISDVYWIVNGNVNLQTIGYITTFGGTVVSNGNISMDTSSTASGGLIAFSSSPDGTVTLNQNVIVCRNSQIQLDGITNDYVNIETILSDSAAIQINAASPNGGILVEAGFGGIAINTTNSISMNANAASNLSTTLGNTLLQSQPGLVDLDGGAGINIGCDNNLANTLTSIVTPTVNVGTSASAKTITIGNTTSTTAVNLNSGSGGITLNASSGEVNIVGNNSASNAINLDASSGTNGITASTGTGGYTVNSGTGKLQLISGNSSVDGIRIDSGAFPGSGGTFLACGTNGCTIGNDGVSHPIVIGNTVGSSSIYSQSGSGGIITHSNSGQNILYSSNTGVDAIRIDSSPSSGGVYVTTSGGSISIGADGYSHPIFIGNTTGTGSTTIESGSFGLTIGNGSSSGEIQVANSSTAKAVTIGNNVSGSRLTTRWQAVWIKHQENSISLPDANTSISATDLLSGLFIGTNPLTNNRSLTLDSISNIITSFGGLTVAKDGDAIDFTIINISSAVDFNYSLTMGTGGSMFGDNIIYPTSNNVIGAPPNTMFFNASNSTSFRLVINITGSSYSVYRIS